MNSITTLILYLLIGLWFTLYFFRTFNRNLAEIKEEALTNKEIEEQISDSYYEEIEELKQKYGHYPFFLLLLLGMIGWLPIILYVMWKRRNKQ
ncbi:hypothetical protein [Massilibacterium senegalense]|uniref:hypothetical protein n=1 Tax=Massilibacterium senegalense TaxID=1632858 RepID=UPI0007826856|nr:hypothetical protein [Massilibacterium senegalense]